ncbi:AI-2E family transporter [Inmirania thermothiophila]|uniref:Putative PurR-regulated permease PerM n=1 Tax=Inmirania thermothiophila TaxID=1750597 RepID=A0A3N1Y341_9GAMM|nr:AI-2E family transporter [Inmirania thermothiophila]ROR31992.1 putative PurR-regulated permease PerM [Inmirania thermothiophila]
MTLWRLPALRAGALFVAVTAAGAALAWLLAPLLPALVLALLLRTALEPLVTALERGGLGRGVAVLAALAVLVGGAALALAVAVPSLAAQLGELQARLPAIWAGLGRAAAALQDWLEATLGLSVDLRSMLPPLVGELQRLGAAALRAVGGALAEAAGLVLLVPVLAFFLLRDFRALRDRLMGLLPNRAFEAGWRIYGRVARRLEAYVRGVMLQSLVMACITGVGFALVGLDLAVLLGALAGLLNVIPYVGPLLAMAGPVLVALAAPQPELWQVAAAAGTVLLAQIVDNVLVVPLVIAQAAALHPLTVIVAVVVAGGQFGFFGMIAAVPLLFTLKIVYRGLREGV